MWHSEEEQHLQAAGPEDEEEQDQDQEEQEEDDEEDPFETIDTIRRIR